MGMLVDVIDTVHGQARSAATVRNAVVGGLLWMGIPGNVAWCWWLRSFSVVLMLLAVEQVVAEEPASKDAYKLAFNGESACVVIPKFRYDGSHPITLEALVIPYASDSEPVRGCVMGNVQHSGLCLNYKPTDWRFNVNDGRPDNLGYAFAKSDEKPVFNKQVHVAGVFDGANVVMFIDGKRQQSVGKTISPHNVSDLDFMIGADPDEDGDPSQFFRGMIDEVRLSKVARYKEDFKLGQQKFAPDADTLALYHFDEGAGEIAKDSSKNKYDGKIKGAKWIKLD